MAQYEWILGQPAETYTVYEWMLGQPYVQIDNTAAPPTGMPMLLKGQLISGALLNGRLIAMCLLIILLMER